MSITYKIWDFPPVRISKQLFHVPGAAVDGGLTSGGARIVSPEPGGFSVLEVQLSMQVDEWSNPWSSWLMSKANGQIFRIPLTKTPQLITARSIQKPQTDAWPRDDDYWHAPDLKTSLKTTFTSGALEGSNVIVIDMKPFGPVLRFGHVFGHDDNTYLVDDIAYDAMGRATVSVTPPFRKRINPGDICLFEPFFLGSIAPGGDYRKTYDAESVGNIQLEKIIFNEVVLP